MRALRSPTAPVSRKTAFALPLKALLLAGAVLVAALAAAPRAHASLDRCGASSSCATSTRPERLLLEISPSVQPELYRSEIDASLLSEQEYTSFSGVGVIACSINGKERTATAFLVGAFDIGVTVAHTFEDGGVWTQPENCVYTTIDSLGQIRERIPVSYVKTQWEAEDGAFGQPAKDLAVVRLTQPSRFAQRTMPLGKFSGAAAPVVLVGFKADTADTVKRKARGRVYERRADGVAVNNKFGFTHDVDSRGIAAGAPVIDERSGVIIGIHTDLNARRNTMITMNEWLEQTLRVEMQSEEQATATP